MAGPRPPVFLERQTYRRRRLMDAARLMPILGAVLFALPLLWPEPESPAVIAGRAEPVPMSAALTYVFGVWAALIALSLVFGLRSRDWAREDSPYGAEGGTEPEQSRAR